MLSANKNKSDKTNEDYDWVWKMRTFHKLNYLYAK